MSSHHSNGRLRFYLVIGLILLAGLPVRADDLRVLPETSPRAPSRLYQALLKQAEAAIDRRTQMGSQSQSPAQARAWQKERRELFLRQLAAIEYCPRESNLFQPLAGITEGLGSDAHLVHQ